MGWRKRLNDDPLPWLLETDLLNPGVRYFTLTELLDLPADDPDVISAGQAVLSSGLVPAVLAEQYAEGYWVEPGPGYLPKYRSSVWQVIFLPQFGAGYSHFTDKRIKAAGDYILDNARTSHGGFSMNAVPSGRIHCLQGNLCAALMDLGFGSDARLREAINWLARSITGEGIAPASERKADLRYLRSGNSAPGFACSANGHMPCAWGAVKAMLALGKVTMDDRTPLIQQAIETGQEFLLGSDPSKADYPMAYSTKPNRSWFKFGYPVGYVTDVLQNLDALTALGSREESRLDAAVDFVLSKQDHLGRWMMEYTYNGKTWVDVEQKGEPSKWVTLRALRVIKRTSL
jgi:hypothetical protein